MSGQKGFVVTIDGPAGAGKSTAAKQLAARLGYSFLDTGAIYRAVALCARRAGIDWGDGPALGALAGRLPIRFENQAGVNRVFVEDADVTGEIRTPDISEGASRVSAQPEVRAALLDLQRAIAARGRVVAEGRDTGTVVFPDAAAKFFLNASPEERARRRALELRAAGRPASEAEVLADMEKRDRRDSTRAAAPLRRADDALEIDTSSLTAAEVVSLMEQTVRARGG
jgi:CMP/dCMP kinase